MDDPHAMRSAALQAISSLQAVIDQATEQMHQLVRIVDATASPEMLLADPDSPANMSQALSRAQTELAAAREALAPFAHAWSRKMEPLADMEIPVFVDPQRPERSRSIFARDLKRANKVLTSMTLGAELLERLHNAELLLRQISCGNNVIQAAQAHIDKFSRPAATPASPSDSSPPPSGGTSETPPE
jgi:hypothetical protein